MFTYKRCFHLLFCLQSPIHHDLARLHRERENRRCHNKQFYHTTISTIDTHVLAPHFLSFFFFTTYPYNVSALLWGNFEYEMPLEHYKWTTDFLEKWRWLKRHVITEGIVKVLLWNNTLYCLFWRGHITFGLQHIFRFMVVYINKARKGSWFWNGGKNCAILVSYNLSC